MPNEMFIRVDVCKPRLDLMILPTSEILEFENSVKGIKQFVKHVKKLKPTRVASTIRVKISDSHLQISSSIKTSEHNVSARYSTFPVEYMILRGKAWFISQSDSATRVRFSFLTPKYKAIPSHAGGVLVKTHRFAFAVC
jgi:hypothetical protein